MKTLIFIVVSLLYSGIAHSHFNQDSQHNESHKITDCKFKVVNQAYLNIFKQDLENRLEQLSQSDNLTFEAVEPREAFTKPYRVKLMSRFPILQYADDERFYGSWEVNCYSVITGKFFNCIDLFKTQHYLYGSIFAHNKDKNISHLLISLADEYVRLTSERFGFHTDEWYNSTEETCYVRQQDTENDIDLYLSPERWQNPSDRWWFNENIKPILEKIITVNDLFHGEYEPY